MEEHHRWYIAIGAVRSGKSHGAVQYVIPHELRERRGKKGLNVILGATRDNVERNVLAPMREIWGKKYVGELKGSSPTVTLFGEKVYIFGAETKQAVSKLRGSEIKFCYCDELCDINEETFNLLKSRLSLDYSVCHGAANPSTPTHFVKRFLDSAEEGVDIYCQKYTIYDNPFLPEAYVRGLEIEYQGTVYYDRYILGLWTKAEGLIYPNYTQCQIERFDWTQSDIKSYVISLDYGTQNAFAATKWVKIKDIWYCVDEYRYSGRDEGHQKTNLDYCNDLVAFTQDCPFPSVETIIDPSATSFKAELRRCETKKFKVKDADNAVSDGLQDTSVSIQMNRIKVFEDCKETFKEFAGYVWDEKQDEDKPIKVDDHLMDSIRYFVRTKRIYKPTKEYTSAFERRRF